MRGPSLRRTAGKRPEVRTGLAHAASGFAMQYNTVVVLRSDEQGEAA